MPLSGKDVENIAHLARLALAEEDIPRYVRELSSILNLVEQLQRVDTEGVPPMAHPLDAHQRLRPDAVTETDQRELFQSTAPLTEAGLYLGPRVIESRAAAQSGGTCRRTVPGEAARSRRKTDDSICWSLVRPECTTVP